MRPSLQAAMRWERQPQIAGQFFADVSQAGGDDLPRGHGESQAVRLPWSMVRILPQNDDFDLVTPGVMKRRKDIGRIDRGPLLPSGINVRYQSLTDRAVPEGLRHLTPIWGNGIEQCGQGLLKCAGDHNA